MKTREHLREPSVSGMFYPANPDKLKNMVVDMLNIVPEKKNSGRIKGLVSPHAGYTYSGQTAAFGYKLLSEGSFENVVILGPSHSFYLNKCSLYPGGFYKTPLGNVPVNSQLAEMLLKKKDLFSFTERAHAEEHSIEVQLPFLQLTLRKFSFLPVVIGFQELKFCREVGEEIYNSVKKNGKKTLFIASSDLSHYHSSDVAKRMDNLVVKGIRNMNSDALYKILKSGDGEACGAGPVLVLLRIMELEGAVNCEVLHQTDSGELTGDHYRVVGYVSIGFFLKS